MIWQSCENLRATTLNESMAEQLCRYLSVKEIELCRRLQGASRAFPDLPPLLSPTSYDAYRLSDTIDDLCKRMQRMSAMPNASISTIEWNTAVEEINSSLWSYLEILETSITELFQQIDQIGFEHWTIELSDAATQIKDELTHRLDDLIWGIRRLERQLADCYAKVVNSSKSMKLWNFCTSLWKRVLDPSIESVAKKCLKFLNFRYGKFVERYVGFLELYDEAEKPLQKQHQHRALSNLDTGNQEKFKQISFLLNLWNLNKTARTLPRGEPVRAVRSFATYESTYQLFKDYLSAIRTSIFDKSRLIKMPFGEGLMNKQSQMIVVDQLSGLQNELHGFATTVDKYRHFLLQTNTKSSSKLGRLFGTNENKHTRSLMGLIEEGEQLDTLCKNFKHSLELGNGAKSNLTMTLEQDISHHLHEMGQPLASKVMMRKNAKAVLQGLQKIDEVATIYPREVDYVSRILSKLMRSDWKYHVLYDIPGFTQFFQTHNQLINQGEDRQHIHRYNAFKKVFQQLEQWIESGDLVKHAHDVELDINDTKALLQDFLGQVQQVERNRSAEGHENKEAVDACMKQMLDYLYLFGYFFHGLNVSDPDQRQLRRRFLFADQYFDAIETTLHPS